VRLHHLQVYTCLFDAQWPLKSARNMAELRKIVLLAEFMFFLQHDADFD